MQAAGSRDGSGRVAVEGPVNQLLMVQRIFHAVTFAIYSYTFFYDTMYLTGMHHRSSYGGRFKFLTFWNLLIQLSFFGYSVVNDFLGSNIPPSTRGGGKGQPSLPLMQRIRDFYAASIVFPLGLFVVMTFWGIYAVDRDMIYPEQLEKLIPAWINHVWHTTVILFLLIEKWLVHHRYPPRGAGLAACCVFGLVYQIWIFWIAHAAQIWVYPVLAVLGWPMRVLFLGGCWALLAGVYCVGELITSLFWPEGKHGGEKARTE